MIGKVDDQKILVEGYLVNVSKIINEKEKKVMNITIAVPLHNELHKEKKFKFVDCKLFDEKIDLIKECHRGQFLGILGIEENHVIVAEKMSLAYGKSNKINEERIIKEIEKYQQQNVENEIDNCSNEELIL